MIRRTGARAATRGGALGARGAALLLLLAAGCGGGTHAPATVAASAAAAAPAPSSGGLPWPAPPDALVRVRAAGLVPERAETLVHHYHSHLDVFVNGVAVRVPGGIGINTEDPGVRHAPLPDGSMAYGGISGCATPCISPLHTHDDTGIVHTESATAAPNTLGEFFTEWGVALTTDCVGGYCRPDALAVYVNGSLFTGNPAAIPLTNHTEIAVVVGSPPARIPAAADFSNA